MHRSGVLKALIEFAEGLRGVSLGKRLWLPMALTVAVAVRLALFLSGEGMIAHLSSLLDRRAQRFLGLQGREMPMAFKAAAKD